MNGEHSAAGLHSNNGEDPVAVEHFVASVHSSNGEVPVNGEPPVADGHSNNGEDPVFVENFLAGVQSSNGQKAVNGEHNNAQHPPEGKYPRPLKLSGALDQFESFHSTPSIGTEFPKANLVHWLKAPNSDELIRELAITSTVPSDHRYQASLTDCLRSCRTWCCIFPRSNRAK